MTTDISLINNINLTELEENISDYKDLYEIIFNFSLDNINREKYFIQFYKNNYDDSIELINRLISMYMISKSNVLFKFLNKICLMDEIDILLRINICKGLCDREEMDFFDDDEEYSSEENTSEENKEDKNIFEFYNNNINISIIYKSLNYISNNLDKILDLNIIIKIDCIIYLMKNPNYFEDSTYLFSNLINNKKIDIEYRYKTILSLENKLYKSDCDEGKLYKDKCLKTVQLSFLNNIDNSIRYRILSSQYLLQNLIELLNENTIINIQQLLLLFGNNETLDINVRADAIDVLLHILNDKEDSEIKKSAEEIILKLGRLEGYSISLYKNAQNVHTKEIQKSVVKILQILSGVSMKKYYFESIKGILLKEISSNDNYIGEFYDRFSEIQIDLINISLNRIEYDRALYTYCNLSLKSILELIYNYIIGKEEDLKKELLIRLYEELIDMANTCSTGYCERIVNTLSGFGEFEINISYQQQLHAYLDNKLNKIIKEIEDEEYKNNIINEMIIDPQLYEERKSFIRFLRENISSIRTEIYEEFKDYISDTDFDLYFRTALIKYEGLHI